MARALVTGATGFVGAVLVRRLLADGHAVHVVARPGADAWRLTDVVTDVERHEADLGDPTAVDALVGRVRPEWVFHLAAHGAYSWQTDLDEMVRTNVIGTMRLVQASVRAGAGAFVHAGSSSEYGLKDHPPREDEWLDPNSHYAVTKAAASMFCRHTGVFADAPVVVLRLYSVYGPWEEPGRLVPTLLAAARAGRLPPLADPDTARDYVYADDVADAFVRAASAAGAHPGRIWNVGTGTQTTLREIVDTVRTLVGVAAEPAWGTMAGRRWDTSVWLADPAAVMRDLGWTARSLTDGLAATLAWLDSTPDAQHRWAAGRG